MAKFVRGHRRQKTETDVLAACKAPLISPRPVSRSFTTAPSSPALPSNSLLSPSPSSSSFNLVEIMIPDPFRAASFVKRDYEREDILNMLPPTTTISMPSSHSRRGGSCTPPLDLSMCSSPPRHPPDTPPSRHHHPSNSSPPAFSSLTTTVTATTNESFSSSLASPSFSERRGRMSRSVHPSSVYPPDRRRAASLNRAKSPPVSGHPFVNGSMDHANNSIGNNNSSSSTACASPYLAYLPRTPSPLLPTIQYTEEDDDEDVPVVVVGESEKKHHFDEKDPHSSVVASCSDNSPLKLSYPSTSSHLRTRRTTAQTELARIVVSHAPIPLPDVIKTPIEERASTITPLPTSEELMLRRRGISVGVNGNMAGGRNGQGKRRVTAPGSLTTLDLPSTSSTTLVHTNVNSDLLSPTPSPPLSIASSQPRRNSFNFDRRTSASAYAAALEARNDRTSHSPIRRLSMAANLWHSATVNLFGKMGLGPPPPSRRASVDQGSTHPPPLPHPLHSSSTSFRYPLSSSQQPQQR